ncbi:MAG: GDP-L-fucose synthase family protein [Phycisphaerae bacterium]
MSYFEDKKVIVTGGAGFLGNAVCERLKQAGAGHVFVPRSSQYDLTEQAAVRRLFNDHKTDVVIHLAADVGGIGANQKHPGQFFYANMAMGLNMVEASRSARVQKFVHIGTVCSYPKHSPTPFREANIWDGFPEETNAPYGVAKRALGLMLAAYKQEYNFPGVYLIPVNLYGPGDNFDLETSHVIPALIRKFSDAAERGVGQVTCWGTGQASREFLYVDDAADAIVTAVMQYDDVAPMNIGTGQEVRIADLASKIAALCNFKGEIVWDSDRPDGQPRRCLDVSRAAEKMNWRAMVDLDEGLHRTVEWWKRNADTAAAAV